MESNAHKNFYRFIELLNDHLKLPLPGKDAQYIMAPEKHLIEKRFSFNYGLAKKAGILILLYLRENTIKTVLIERTDYKGVHSKQISFPGGKREESDPDLFSTACRETNEEIGVPCPEVTLIGKLSELYIPPSNFQVFPFVGYTNNPPVFKADPAEVQNILEVNLSLLLDESVIADKQVYTAEHINIVAPCFYVYNAKIWGATAMIISELKTIIKKIPEAVSILRS